MEADKLAKEAEKQAKEAKKLEEAQSKLDKEAKLTADKLAKEADKLAKEAEKQAKKQTKEAKKPAAAAADDEEPDVVKRIEFEGKKYLKSKKSGVIYDYTEYTKNSEQIVIGKWNESKSKIDFNETSEESEDEYDN